MTEQSAGNNEDTAAAIADGNLGQTTDRIALTTHEEHHLAVDALARQARRSIGILSQALEPDVLDRPAFAALIKQLVTASPRSEVRILVRDPSSVSTHGHVLVALAQRLPTAIHIHQPAMDYADMDDVFLLADDTGLWQRNGATGSLFFHTPAKAREVNTLFNRIWDTSEPAVVLRRLSI